MPTDQTPKQLIVERIKNASNILVTVSRNPSVDELAGALALTLMLDKMDKVSTAVFSGELPSAIDFLEPGKTFEENVDSLRDFIIALDKTKADRLRYKVEDDVVRVFITPYKTTISESDLTFAQGDFNVDLIIALGVEKREDLDTAITVHGRILHDATTVTINTTAGEVSLGEVDWTDTGASSYCEMLMSLSEALQAGLLDQPIATAILTGLVSATDRFRNDKTSPKVMTMSAQLMAAGANQQLIAEKLEEAVIVEIAPTENPAETKTSSNKPSPKKTHDGEMKIDHEEVTVSSDESPVVIAPQTPAEKASNDALKEAEAELDHALSTNSAAQSEDSAVSNVKSGSWRDVPSPSFGGTLNATTEEAEETKQHEADDDRNRVLLSHDGTASQAPPLNATTLPPLEPTVPDIFAQPAVAPQQTAPLASPSQDDTLVTTQSGIGFEATPVPVPSPVASTNPTLADLEAEVNRQHETPVVSSSVDDARAAVDAALGSLPFDPAGQPLASVGAQPLGDDIAHVDTSPIAPVVPAAPLLPPLPPLPDFSTLPGAPSQPADQVTPPAVPNFGLPEQPATTDGQAPAASDPAQFQLPGQ